MSDLIDRQAAIDELTENKDFIGAAIDSLELDYRTEANERERLKQVIDDIETIKGLPSVQPEITDIQAIEQLQASGWMQNHDKQMYEMGLKEQLADDSGSYDALLPSVQPEPCEDAVSRSEIIRLILERGLYCDTQADREISADIIRQLPSVLPEIIRCGECKYWQTTWQNDDWSPNYHYCPNVDGVRRNDFYCGDAERRDDADHTEA